MVGKKRTQIGVLTVLVTQSLQSMEPSENAMPPRFPEARNEPEGERFNRPESMGERPGLPLDNIRNMDNPFGERPTEQPFENRSPFNEERPRSPFGEQRFGMGESIPEERSETPPRPEVFGDQAAGEMPPPPQSFEDRVPNEEQSEDQLIAAGIHTIDVEDEGNWVLKRVWWEQAEIRYEQLVNLNDKVGAFPLTFVTKKSDLDKQIETVFKNVGLEQTEIIDLLNFITQSVQILNDDVQVAQLWQREKEILDALNAKKEQFEQVNTELNGLAQNDALLNEVLMQIMTSVNECRQYELQSWKNFKEIARVLNDAKARELFYGIETNYKNVEAVFNYLQHDLNSYSTTIMQSMEQQADKISSLLNDIKQAGINLKQQVVELKELEEEKKKQEALAKQKAEEQQTKKAPVKPQGWFERTWSGIKAWFGLK